MNITYKLVVHTPTNDIVLAENLSLAEAERKKLVYLVGFKYRNFIEIISE